MFAVIKTGGKQYKVQENDIINVEHIDLEAGKKFKIKDILMTEEKGKVSFGSPLIDKGEVEAEIVEHYKDKKVIVFKKQRRQNYRRKTGHRQMLTKIKINKIKV